jgi:clan AA aspartic protease (TIGR02281 family)
MLPTGTFLMERTMVPPDSTGQKDTSPSRPSAAHGEPRPRPRPLPDAPRLTITRRGPSPLLRIVSYGSWLIALALLAVFLKGLNEARLQRIKAQVREMQAHSAPPSAPAGPSPEAEIVPPAPEPEPAMAMVRPVEPAPRPPEPVAKGAEPAPPPTKFRQLAIAPAANGNYYVRGQINGHDAAFMVDTGASAVAIPDRLRWKLGLTRGSYLQSSTAGGITGMYETEVKQLTVGPLRFRNVRAVLNPSTADETILLGMTALKEIRMVQQNGRMLLQQEETPADGPAPASPAPPPALKKSVSQCMGADKVVNERVLRCMQGVGDGSSE